MIKQLIGSSCPVWRGLPNKMCAISAISAISPFSFAGCRSFAGPLPNGGGFCSGILTGLAYGGVRWCVSKLSKLLHQEDALGVPFSGCDFCSPQALPGRRNAADRRDPSLSCHIYCCYTQVIAPTCADAFPVVGGSARVKSSGAGPSRAVVKAALTCGFLLP